MSQVDLWERFHHSEGRVETLFATTCETRLCPRTYVHNKDGHSFLQHPSFTFSLRTPKKEVNPSAFYDEMALQHTTMLLTPWLCIRAAWGKVRGQWDWAHDST
jgi:hypothetical protein